MATRTCRIMGLAFGDPANPATMTVDFAGERVFSGTVPTRAGPAVEVSWDQHDILCSWNTMVNLGDTVSIAISVINGPIKIGLFGMNNRGDKVDPRIKDNITWPSYQPGNIDDLLADLSSMEKSAFESRYGFPNSRLDQYIEGVVTTPAQDFFPSFPRTAYSNVKVNDQPGEKNPGPLQFRRLTNFPHYDLDSGETLSYDLSLVNWAG